jgi:hypothetical protein
VYADTVRSFAVGDVQTRDVEEEKRRAIEPADKLEITAAGEYPLSYFA